jgi:GGDEF domain-containing protein
MIAELGTKLKSCVADRGTVFRSNGDEFIVVAETDELDEVRQMANEIKQTVSAEILVDNRKFFLTSSIGVCAGKCHENFEQA